MVAIQPVPNFYEIYSVLVNAGAGKISDTKKRDKFLSNLFFIILGCNLIFKCISKNLIKVCAHQKNIFSKINKSHGSLQSLKTNFN
mgnify:CR=1 FL=1